MQVSPSQFHPQTFQRCRLSAREMVAPSWLPHVACKMFIRARGGRNTQSWAFHGTRKVQPGTVKGWAREKGWKITWSDAMHACEPMRTRWRTERYLPFWDIEVISVLTTCNFSRTSPMLLQEAKHAAVSKVWCAQRVDKLWLDTRPSAPSAAAWSAH